MNYEILAKRLFVRKKFSRGIWKSEVVIITGYWVCQSWYFEFSGSGVKDFSPGLFCHRKDTFLKFFWTLDYFISFYSLFYLRNSYCSYQIYRHSHFPLIFAFDLGFFCYILQYTTCEIKLSFLEKPLQVLTYFVEPYILYLNHFVNRQNWGTHLNCQLSYGTNFLEGQSLKKKYCLINANFQSQVLFFLPSKFQKIISFVDTISWSCS